jgi:FkbM family methyltransferase
MMNGMRHVLEVMSDPFWGRLRMQAFWEAVEDWSVAGLGVGRGANVTSSGELAFLRDFVDACHPLGRPITCFDVGANVGLWSQALADCARRRPVPLGIVAFEPSHEARAQLHERFESDPTIRIEAVALGDHSGTATLYADAEGSGLGSLYERRLDHFGLETHGVEAVPVATLDDYCATGGVGHIDLLKLDVEGAKLDVLRGAAKMLEQGTIGLIQFEFGGCNIDSRTYFQDFWYLLRDSFSVYRIVKDGLWPVDAYRESLERFTTTNYVAIRHKDQD